MIRIAVWICSLSLALAGTAPALAQPAAAQSASTGEVVAAARKVLADRYVLPDIAARLDVALGDAERAGAFRGLSGAALADRLNAEIRTVTPDAHLGFMYDPALAAEIAAAPPEEEGVSEAAARRIAQANGGVRKLELLPGNIRYLAYDGFQWGTDVAPAAIDDAMRFLQGGDAVIIDLRRNGGGSPDAVARLASYFLPAGTKLARFEMRGEPGEATETPAAPFSLAGKPTYVLISPGTFSAAEEFATHVSAFGFGTLVGETTGGGGFRNEFMALPGGFVVSVSIGRPVHAVTGGDWEQVGVAPAIAVPADQALLAAQAAAMETLLAAMPAEERAENQRLLAFYRAQVTPVAPALPLEAYAGTYGERVIGVAGGVLTSSRLGRPAVELKPIAPDTFVPMVNPTQQFRFVGEGGAVAALEVDSGDGPERAERAVR